MIQALRKTAFLLAGNCFSLIWELSIPKLKLQGAVCTPLEQLPKCLLCSHCVLCLWQESGCSRLEGDQLRVKFCARREGVQTNGWEEHICSLQWSLAVAEWGGRQYSHPTSQFRPQTLRLQGNGRALFHLLTYRNSCTLTHESFRLGKILQEI